MPQITRRTTPRKPPQTQKPKRKKGTQKTRKPKKTIPLNILQALLLVFILIAVSAIISAVILGVKQKKAQQTDSTSVPHITLPEPEMPEIPETAAPDNLPLRDTPPAKEISAAQKPPPEKQQPVTPAAKTTAEKAPAPQSQSQSQSQPRQPVRTPAPQTSVSQPARPLATPPELPPPPKRQGTLVFVIDDAGNNLQELEPFLRFPGPLTIAVLPGLPHSAEAARRIRAAGKEVFLHQPMEAIGGQAPGPGAIYTGMTADEITTLLAQNIAEVGPVTGINNHQGSKITMDQQAMETVLAFCRKEGLYFLDSKTTSETAARAAAKNLGIKIGERNIFIDNEKDRVSMSRFIKDGLALASQKGSAVMIGHTSSPELAPLLTELYQDFIAQGYALTTASELIR